MDNVNYMQKLFLTGSCEINLCDFFPLSSQFSWFSSIPLKCILELTSTILLYVYIYIYDTFNSLHKTVSVFPFHHTVTHLSDFTSKLLLQIENKKKIFSIEFVFLSQRSLLHWFGVFHSIERKFHQFLDSLISSFR